MPLDDVLRDLLTAAGPSGYERRAAEARIEHEQASQEAAAGQTVRIQEAAADRDEFDAAREYAQDERGPASSHPATS